MTDKIFAKKAVSYFLPTILTIICLFVYVIYRPEEIILNQYIFAKFPSLNDIKLNINSSFPLNNFIIYNLPAGLWVMALTFCSGDYKLPLFSRKIQLAYLPIIIGLIIEFAQLTKLTDGTFDPIDIVTMLGFAFLTFRIKRLYYFNTQTSNTQPLITLTGFVILFFGNI